MATVRGDKAEASKRPHGSDAATGAGGKRSASRPPLVVGVGASAGGLEAFTELLRRLPTNTGMAFALVQHLEPTHVSNLAEILGRATAMPVTQVVDGMAAERDHVYVIPPDAVMRLADGAFVLSARGKGRTPVLSVDILLESLAEQFGDRAIGIVLSGAASDGVKGLAAIEASGGITIVQDPDTAAYRGMPASAIAAGVADSVLAVPEIATELVRLARHPYIRTAAMPEAAQGGPAQESVLLEIAGILHEATGVDLSHYKRATLRRRIERRMAMRRVDSYEDYLGVLRSHGSEVAALFGEALVRVTSFFRDPEAFEALGSIALAKLTGGREGPAVRVWTAGCATGQEAYSIAMLLVEHLEQRGSARPVQIFASDLREADLEFARRGVYPPEVASEVSAQRLTRFFTRVEGGYQVNKSIREMCVFARHDVAADPPFARVDLVTCRNLLIYMDSALQKRVLTLFHYALVDGGTLFLGKSEGAGAAPGLFEPTENKSIFRRPPGRTPALVLGGRAGREPRRGSAFSLTPVDALAGEAATSEALQRLDELLLERYSPAAVMVDSELTVLQLRGDVGAFLRPRPGPASLSLANMASTGLVKAVRAAIDECAKTGMPTRRSGLKVRVEAGYRTVELVVFPLARTGAPASYAVLIGDEKPSVDPGGADQPSEATELEYLRQELAATSDKLRFESQRRDTVAEELRAANEEVQSSNEELQSINEELETAKEELESTNEELATLNDELQTRNRELGVRNEDLNNLLGSVCIPIVMLDRDLVIRRYTAQAAALFSLIPADVGRPITDIRSHLDMADFDAVVHGVLGDGVLVDRDVADDGGHWYRMSVRPYRTEEGRIEGVVISLLDIDAMRRYQSDLERIQSLSETINRATDAYDQGGSLSEATGRVVAMAAEVLGAGAGSFWRQDGGVWTLAARAPEAADSAPGAAAVGAEARALDAARKLNGPAVVPERGLEPGLEVRASEHGMEAVTRVVLTVTGAQASLIGAVIFEYTAPRPAFTEAEWDFCRKLTTVAALALERAERDQIARELADRLVADLRRTTIALQESAHVKDSFLANMSHELRTPLNSIIGFSTVLLEGLAGELNEEQRRQMEMVLSSGRHLLQIVSDILDLEKIEAGAMPVTITEFEVSPVIDEVVSLIRPIAEAKGVDVLRTLADECTTLVTDELKLRQILLNLVSNAVKFTDAGRVAVSVTCDGDDMRLEVSDTGRGMTADELERSFIEFRRVAEDGLAVVEGTGLGLSIARRLCVLLGGELTAESSPGAGSTFRATVKRRLAQEC